LGALEPLTAIDPPPFRAALLAEFAVSAATAPAALPHPLPAADIGSDAFLFVLRRPHARRLRSKKRI
jgi:hypothetical protein